MQLLRACCSQLPVHYYRALGRETEKGSTSKGLTRMKPLISKSVSAKPRLRNGSVTTAYFLNVQYDTSAAFFFD